MKIRLAANSTPRTHASPDQEILEIASRLSMLPNRMCIRHWCHTPIPHKRITKGIASSSQKYSCRANSITIHPIRNPAECRSLIWKAFPHNLWSLPENPVEAPSNFLTSFLHLLIGREGFLLLIVNVGSFRQDLYLLLLLPLQFISYVIDVLEIILGIPVVRFFAQRFPQIIFGCADRFLQYLRIIRPGLAIVFHRF